MESNFHKQIKQPFGWEPNSIIFDNELSLKAKGLWLYMNSKPEGWHFAADRIAEENSDGREAIQAGLRELIQHGYLIAKRKGDGRFEYILIDRAEPKPEKPTEGQNPQPENPTEAKAHGGKTPLVNNKEDNKNRVKERKSATEQKPNTMPAGPALEMPASRPLTRAEILTMEYA